MILNNSNLTLKKTFSSISSGVKHLDNAFKLALSSKFFESTNEKKKCEENNLIKIELIENHGRGQSCLKWFQILLRDHALERLCIIAFQ